MRCTVLVLEYGNRMAIVYDGGQWVWAPDEEAAFLPGKVKTSFKSGEAGVVILEDGEELPLTAAQTKDLLKMDNDEFVIESDHTTKMLDELVATECDNNDKIIAKGKYMENHKCW